MLEWRNDKMPAPRQAGLWRLWKNGYGDDWRLNYGCEPVAKSGTENEMMALAQRLQDVLDGRDVVGEVLAKVEEALALMRIDPLPEDDKIDQVLTDVVNGVTDRALAIVRSFSTERSGEGA
jgi:hypothetical protein